MDFIHNLFRPGKFHIRRRDINSPSCTDSDGFVVFFVINNDRLPEGIRHHIPEFIPEKEDKIIAAETAYCALITHQGFKILIIPD